MVSALAMVIMSGTTPKASEQARLNEAVDALRGQRDALVLITHHHSDHHAYARALADRLGVDEVRAFATLLQQSKELGTSLSGALKVFSDEMRHKRMSAAEEKAHALPAKMSIPVTVCILPVVVMIAIIPIIVRFNT